jgi:hypothetical protein
MTNKQKEIITRWGYWEEVEPDISTEQLMARVCADTFCDAGEVAEALEQEAIEKKDLDPR